MCRPLAALVSTGPRELLPQVPRPYLGLETPLRIPTPLSLPAGPHSTPCSTIIPRVSTHFRERGPGLVLATRSRPPPVSMSTPALSLTQANTGQSNVSLRGNRGFHSTYETGRTLIMGSRSHWNFSTFLLSTLCVASSHHIRLSGRVIWYASNAETIDSRQRLFISL